MQQRNCTECGASVHLYHRFKKCDECEPIHFADVKVGDIIEAFNSNVGFGNNKYKSELKILKLTKNRIETSSHRSFHRNDGKETGKDNRYNHLIHPDERHKYEDYKLSRYFEPRTMGA